jgi:predicted amidohydrolase YtcJ
MSGKWCDHDQRRPPVPRGGGQGLDRAGQAVDLVILDRNPMTVDPDAIKDIRIIETIKEGRTIYRREAGE